MNKNIFIFVALIIALTSAQTTITPGVTFTSTTSFRAWSYFSLKLSESTINYVKLVTTVSSGTPFYYADVGSLPTFQNNTWKYENTTAGPLTQYFYNPNIDRNTGNFNNAILYLAVYGYTNTKYTFVFYTQGPITIYDRQIYSPSFPVPSVYLFFNFQVDPMLRRLQIVTADNLSSANFYASNSTTNYPVYGGTYQYSSKYYNTLKTSCVFTDYPYPGNYRLGVYGNIISYNFTLQFVENGVQSCKIES